mmetsp:Transcript_4452/g.7760  ORF Transcript_4452/g.7760 Transcript_4452/m.7760 type:complete len:96 (+) Transcript_4452:249-536(+)
MMTSGLIFVLQLQNLDATVDGRKAVLHGLRTKVRRECRKSRKSYKVTPTTVTLYFRVLRMLFPASRTAFAFRPDFYRECAPGYHQKEETFISDKK